MALMTRSTHDPKLTRWWWRTLREWVYELIDPLWGAFRGENTDDIALANVTGINDVSASELAVLDGLTATNTELNKLSGLTADASELNKADRTAADGIAEALKNVVLDANKDIIGKRYDLSQSLIKAWTNRPCLHFPGSGYVQAADDPNLDVGTKDYSIAFTLKTPITARQGLFSKAQSNANQTPRWWATLETNGNIEFYQHDGTYSDDFVSTGDSFNDGSEHHVVIVVKRGVSIALYDNGVLDNEDTSDNTATLSLDNTGDLFIGTRYLGSHLYLDGEIYNFRLYNRALSGDEVKALASGAPIVFANMGASQTDLVTNGEDWTGATGSTPPNSWSDTGAGTATYIIRDNTPVANFGDDKALELNVSGGSKTLYQGVAQAGKRYRVSFVYRNLDGSSSSYVALGSSDNKVTLQNTGISGDGIVFEQELLADGTDLKFFVDTGGTLQIDHVQVTQVGCVAAYLPDGITHAQWQDASGNDLHGSVNGAIPLNLPSSHVARYIKQGITGDTTLSAAVPAGYRIKSMVADVSGAGAGMRLNIGTSAGGTDVVNNQDISSNGLFDLMVAKNIFSFSTAQSLYVNDDGGTAWSGVSVDLYIDLERVK